MLLHLTLLIIIFIIYVVIYSSRRFKNKNKIFLIYIFVVLFTVSAFRTYNIGNDTLTYIAFFKNTSVIGLDILNSTRYEIGYVIYNYIVSLITSDPRIFIIITSFIFCLIPCIIIYKESKNPLLSILIFVNFLYFYQSFTMLRQFFAIVIILYAFKYIKNRNFIKYTISVIIASMFHISALILFILYPLYKIKYSDKKAMLCFAFCIIVTIFSEQIIKYILILLGKNGFYMDDFGSNNIANVLKTIIFILYYLFMRINYNKNIKDCKEYSFYLFLAILSITINAMAINMNTFSRQAIYFNIFTIISMPNVIELIKNERNKRIIYLVFVLFLFLYSFSILFFRPEWLSLDGFEFSLE